MNPALVFLLGMTFGCLSDIVHGAVKNQQDLFGNLGLDMHLDWAESAWDRIFGLEPEVTMDTMERIRYNGYPAENHKTTTKDGYILQLHRIPSKDKSRIPVVLVHGTFGMADYWLGNTKENNLPFLLADSGEDVWFVNLRGCQNSIQHTTRDTGPFSEKFWAFSFDEMANYDMPAFVDYVLKATGHRQVYLVGHSLGGGLPILLLAENPEYNEKVKAIFALAPIGNLEDFGHRSKWLVQFSDIYQIITKVTSLYECFLPLSKRMVGTLVKVYGFIYKLPMAKDYLLDGKNWNFTRAPNYFTSLVSSTSYLLLYHYGQFIQKNGADGLRHYNWGAETNAQKYGEPYPPLYNLSAVLAPVYLYCGGEDNLISETNVKYLQARLPNVVSYILLKNWGHIDFMWAYDTAPKLYNPLVSIIKNDY